MAALHGRLERGQVYLVQGSIVDQLVDVVAVVLLVVCQVVLRGGDHALGLDAANVVDDDLPGQEGIFAVGLERATVQRRAGDVDVRAIHDVAADVPGLPAHHDAVGPGDRRVEGR